MVRRAVVLALLSLILAPSTALAYLDPGSSSLVFQAAAAALFTLLFVLRTWWARIVAFFRRGRPAAPVAPDPTGTVPPPGRDR
jgi:hypothetical protein